MLPDVPMEVTQELTSFEYVEPLSTVQPAITERVRKAPSTVSYEISNMFGRPRKLTTFTFNVGTATANQYVSPWKNLDDDVLGSYADMFAFMRWESCTLFFVTKTNPLQYGMVFYSYIPYVAVGFLPELFENILDFNPVVVDITSQQEVKMVIPWHAPTKYVRTGDAASTSPHCRLMGTLCAVTPQPLDSTDSNALDAVVTDIYVSYQGVQFQGPSVRSDSYEMRKIKKRYTVLKAKMDGQMEQIYNAVGDLANRGADHVVKRVVGKIADISIDEVANAAYAYWSGSPEPKEAPTRQTKFEPFNNDCAFGDNSIPKTLSDCRETQPKSMDSETHSFLELIMRPALKTWGVLTTALPSFSFVPHPRFPGGIPVQDVTTPAQLRNMMGSGYLSYMSQYFSQFRGGIKLKFVFTCNSFMSARIRICLAYGDNQTTMDLSSYNQNIPTKFVQVKGLTHCEMTIPQCVLYDWIPLSTSAGFEMIPRVYVFLDGATINSGNGDRTPTIQYFLWWAAAEDFQFRMLCNVGQGAPYQGVVEMDGQMEPWRDFQSSFENFGGVGDDPVQISTDQPKSVEDLLTRFCLAKTTDPEVSLNFFSGASNTRDMFDNELFYPRVFSLLNDTINGAATLFDSICALYMFNAGCVDFKISVTNVTDPPMPAVICVGRVTGSMMDGTPLFYPDPEFPDIGNVTVDVSQWKVLDFSMPFIGTVPWDTWIEGNQLTCQLPNTVQSFGQSWSSAPQTIWKKAGRDFKVTQLLPVPARTLWPMYTYYAYSPELVRKSTKGLNLKPFPTWKNRKQTRAINAPPSFEATVPVTQTTSLSDEFR
jgi:hypothetical protein